MKIPASFVRYVDLGVEADSTHTKQLYLRLKNIDSFFFLIVSSILLVATLINFGEDFLLAGSAIILVSLYSLAVILSKYKLHNYASLINFFVPIIYISFLHYYLGADCFFPLLLLGVSLATLIYCTLPKAFSVSLFAFHFILFIVFTFSQNKGVANLSNESTEIIFKTNILLAVIIFSSRAGMLHYLYSSLTAESNTSRIYYKRLFEESLNGLFITDENFNIIRTNKAFREMLGYEENEIIGKHIGFSTAPEYIDECCSRLDKLVRGEESECNMQKAYIRKDKTLFYAHNYLRKLVHDEEQGTEYIVSVHDMNDHVHAQNALQKSEEKYRDIFENVTEAILTLDAETNIVQANKAAYELMGRSPEEEIKIKDIVHKPDKEKSDKYFKKLVTDGSYTGYQGRIYNPLTGVRYIEVNSSGIFDKNGKLIGSRDIIRDITAQKKQEEELQNKMQELNEKNIELQKYIKSNMQLENFAHIASHDLKAPLRTIVSFSQLLERSIQSKMTETEAEYLNFITNSTQNLYVLVNDLLTYSKVNSSAKELELININVLLESLLAELRSNINEKKAIIYTDCPIHFIVADKVKIRQLFQNLIVNAIKFSKPSKPPVIYINAFEKENVWQFSVSDNGIGISKEYHEKVFMLFRKLNPVTEYQGSGIGLAVCKLIVEQHAGEIWIDSKPEEGTTFHFTIKKEQSPLNMEAKIANIISVMSN